MVCGSVICKNCKTRGHRVKGEFDRFDASEQDALGETHFGFERVAASGKAGRVAEVFDSVAPRYDIMNDLMSFGLHRLWKRFAIQLSGARPRHSVLDLAGGTGDLGALFARRVGEQGRVVVADINPQMLRRGRDKLIDSGWVSPLPFALVDGEQLPFAEASFDCVIIGFGLRNVTRKEHCLAEMRRVVKPGGRVLVLEFSQVRSPLLKRVYDAYSFSILPRLGKAVARDAASYQYLAESIRMHPDQQTLAQMMNEVGLERCEWFDLHAGIVAVHRGFRL